MTEENITRKFRMRNIDETRNYFVEKKGQNELMRKKNNKVWPTLKY